MNYYEINFETGKSFSLQIAEHMLDLINKNVLASGQKLPVENELKQIFKVSLSTVKKAMRMLKSWGGVISIPRRGYYVRGATVQMRLPSGKAGFVYDDRNWRKKPRRLGVQNAVLRLDLDIPYNSGRLHERFVKEFRRSQQPLLLANSAAKHLAALNTALISHLEQFHGVKLEPSQLSLVQGKLEGYRNVLTLFVNSPGEYIVMRGSCCLEVRELTRTLGYKVKLIDAATEEVFVGQVEALARRGAIKALVIESRSDGTFGTCLSEQWSKRLLSLSRQYKFALIEMDFDREFDTSGFRPLFYKSPSQIIYISCASKTAGVLSGLQLVLGPKDVISSLRRLNENISIMEEQCLAAILTIVKHELLLEEIDKMRAMLQSTQRVMGAVFGAELHKRVRYCFAGAGPYITFFLPFNCKHQVLADMLAAEGIQCREFRTECTLELPFKVLKLSVPCLDAFTAQDLAANIATIINKSLDHRNDLQLN